MLCKEFGDMVAVLKTLCETFTVTRIKSRIGPSMAGNKAILVNLVVEDNFVPIKYKWSHWWDNKSTVKMLAEVRVIIIT